MNLKSKIRVIEKLSVLELNELVKAAEEKFGVSASAPVVVGGDVAGGESADESRTHAQRQRARSRYERCEKHRVGWCGYFACLAF